MKKRNWLLLLLLFIPTIVFAKSSSSSGDSEMSAMFGASIMMAIIQYFFIIHPIENKNNVTPTFNAGKAFKEIAVAVVVNFVLVNVIGDAWYALGFILGIFVGIPLSFIVGRSSSISSVNNAITPDPKLVIPGCAASAIIRCTKCNTVMRPNDQFCPECGAAFKDDNAKVEPPDKNDLVLNLNNFDSMYTKPETELINDIIDEEMKALELDPDCNMVPSSEKVRLVVLNIIFSVLLFLFIGLIFYHVNYMVYIFGLIILIVFFVKKNKIDLKKYIVKELKARPNENIDNIIGSIKENLVSKNTIVTGIILPILVIIGSAFLFKDPIILYEPIENGYAMRFYFAGWSNLSYASIPEEHNGKPVTSLRGNAFSNMPYLKEVYLPDSITEIRGEAFKNDSVLEKVHLPANLKYLGGESFYGCYKLKDINLTYDTPLEEIKGDTFEECHSLTEITIPDSVTRIGGHAFYNDYSLAKVNISENSKLAEIGSSAFRICTSLKSIKIPASTVVNDKAFKQSPTKVIRFGNADEYNNPESNETKTDAFSISLYEYVSIDLKGSGKITFENIGYDSTTKKHTIKVYGYKETVMELDDPITYPLNDYYYVYLIPSSASSTVYGYLKTYSK